MWVQYCHNCVIYTVYSNSKFQNRGTNTYIHIHILKSEENINFYVNYAYCWPLEQARFTGRSSSLICLKLRTVVTYTWHGDTCGEGVAPAIVDMTGTQVAADWPVTRVAGGTGTTPPRPLHREQEQCNAYWRRIYTKEKAKVVVAAWGTKLIKFLADLTTRTIWRIL